MRPRIAVAGDHLVVRYAAGVVVLWIALAVIGLVVGAAAVSDGRTEGGYLGVGLGAVCTFVAWFAARPVLTADRAGLTVLPLFGSTTSLPWAEVRSVGVRRVKAARGRGDALVIDASDDREIRVDGLWVGLTSGALQPIGSALAAFADQVGAALAPVPSEPEPW